MDPVLIKKIQDWVQLDNKVREIKENIKKLDNKELIEQKDELEKGIVEHIEKNKLDMITINTSDGMIKFAKNNVKSPLTAKFLKQTLDSFGTDNPSSVFESSSVFEYIMEKLEVKSKTSIKRVIRE